MSDTYEEYQKRWWAAFSAAGHEPRMVDDVPDIFVTGHGHHNGPGCALCGWTTCWHCNGPEKIPQCAPRGKSDATKIIERGDVDAMQRVVLRARQAAQLSANALSVRTNAT